ncbi:MAG: hypothetical protein OHK0053_13300 [Microscillaceae bacterium]
MKRLCLLWVFFLVIEEPSRAYAQMLDQDTLRFSTQMSLGGNWQQGNVKALILRARADMSLAPHPNWLFKTQNVYLRQSFFSQKADEDIYSRNFIYFLPQRRVFPFGLAFIATNFRRKIDWRYFAGGGISWQILRRPLQNIRLALSGVFENTRFALSQFNLAEYNGQETVAATRLGLWLFGRHRLGLPALSLAYEAYFQPALDVPNNYRGQTTLTLDGRLSPALALQITYLFAFEKLVAREQRQSDQLLTFGLSIQFNSKSSIHP